MKVVLVILVFFLSVHVVAQDLGAFDAYNEMPANYFPIKVNGKWKFKNLMDSLADKNEFFDTIHFCVSEYHSTHFLAVKGTKYSFFDANLMLIDSGKMVNFKMAKTDLFIQWGRNWKRYHFNSEALTNFQADSIFTTGDFTYIFDKGKTGIITESAFIPPVYFRIAPFKQDYVEIKNNYFIILNKNKYGLIDYSGNVVISEVATIIQQEDFQIIKYQEEHWKYLLPNGKVVDPMGCEIHFFGANEYKIYSKDRSKAVLYRSNKAVAKTQQYDDIFPQKSQIESYYFVKKGNKIGMLDEDLKLVILPFCDQLEFFKSSSGLNRDQIRSNLKFLQNDKWGVVSLDGNILIAPNYDNILQKQELGNQVFYKVAKNGLVGVIDQNEKVIIPFEYANINVFGEGFVTEKNQKIGFANKLGKPVFDNVYDAYRESYSQQSYPIAIFKKENKLEILNYFGEQITPKPCRDFQFQNNVLKCYYDDGIVVYYLEKGRVVETSPYPGIKIAEIRSLENRGFHNCGGFDKEYLELNQLTGKYASRRMLRSGLAMEPTYAYADPTAFGSFYEAAKIRDTSIHFGYKNFPEIKSNDVYKWIDCSNGSHHNENVLASGILGFGYIGGFSSSDVFTLNENEKMHWITNDNRAALNTEIVREGLVYIKSATEGYQFVVVGGEIEKVQLEDSYVSFMDYFHFLNKGNNNWFASSVEAAEIMNPKNGLRFKDSRFILRPTLNQSSKSNPIEIDSLICPKNWSFLAYKKKGQKTWNLTMNLMTEKEPSVIEIVSIQFWEDQSRDVLILDKSVNKDTKKAIYDTNLNPLTGFEYDEIHFAGTNGFLVRVNQDYFYLDQFGQKVDL